MSMSIVPLCISEGAPFGANFQVAAQKAKAKFKGLLGAAGGKKRLPALQPPKHSVSLKNIASAVRDHHQSSTKNLKDGKE
jgi:hypothetical protein